MIFFGTPDTSETKIHCVKCDWNPRLNSHIYVKIQTFTSFLYNISVNSTFLCEQRWNSVAQNFTTIGPLEEIVINLVLTGFVMHAEMQNFCSRQNV